MTRIALRLVPLLLALLLAPAALGNVYQYQPYPSNPPLLTSNCTALNDSSELVLAYPARLNGQGWSGMCAFSFCYQLYSTPFPNQDPTTATYTMSGYLITSPTSQISQDSFQAFPAVSSYPIMDAVGVRNQSQFMFGQSCGAPYPTANITGVDMSGQQPGPYPDNYLTVTYPYMSVDGWLLDIDQPLWWPIDSNALEQGRGIVAECSTNPIQVGYHWSQGDSQLWPEGYNIENFPLTSMVQEFYIGTTNYAQISVQEHSEGSGTQFPSCPYYVPPATTVLPFAYNIQQTVANALVQSSCASGSMTVSGPYDRYPGYQSWFVVNATGTRSFIDVHNRTVTQRILGIATVTVTANNYVQAGPDPPLNGYPLWPDNAVLVDAYGNVSPSYNGLLFMLDGVPYSGAMVVAETPYVLFARSTNDGHVAEIAQVPQTDGSNPGDWTQVDNEALGLVITSDGDSSFSFVVGSFSWNQSTIYSGLTCPVRTPSVSWTPGTTDYNDPAGLTQVGFGYRWVVGYTPGTPASSVCIAGILTIDLLLPGDGVRAAVANATGVRVYADSTGIVNITKLIAVPYNAFSPDGTNVPSYWYYNQSNPINDEQNGQGSFYAIFGLLFDGPVDGQGGATGTHSTSLSWHIDLPTSSSGGISVEELRFSSSTPVYQYDLPSTLTVFPLTGPGSFVPSSYCPADTSLLATAPGASSIYTNTLPQQQLSIAYSLVPNNFNPENEWLVCATINLTLAATSSLVGTISGPVAQFFQVVNASGSRTFLNLATGVGVITSITGLAGPADLLSYQPPSDNLVSLTSPYLSFNGLSLRTSSVPTYSTGVYGPSAFALMALQQVPMVSDWNGALYWEIMNGIVEASSPDGQSSNSVYYTVGATTPLEQTCDTIVATLQANALKDTTITVPFSYSIEVTADSTYEWWAVCVTGTLTLLSTPFYINPGIPSAYVIRSVSGTRTFYNAWGQASMASIVAAIATSATDANLYYPDASGNNFPGAGLTVTLSSSALYNSYLMNPANITTYTITTSSSSSGVSVSESIGDYSHIQSASYAAGSVLPGSTATLPVCLIASAFPSSPATTTLYFSLTFTSASLLTSICFQGSLTVAMVPVTTVNSTAYTWYPVLAASGSRVYTDMSIGQSYTQTIAGLAAPFTVSVNGMVNDNLLGVPVGTALASASTAAVSPFGLSLSFSSPPYNPSGIFPTVETLQLGTSGDGLESVVDPNFVPDVTSTISLSSSTSALQCAVQSNSSLIPPAATVLYWKLNGTINDEAAECMSGTLQTGTGPLLPNGPGIAAVSLTSVTGTRYYWDSYTKTAQVASITGLATVPGYSNSITLTSPYLPGFGLGLGLSFNTSILQPFNPNDYYTGLNSSSYNYTVLSWSGSSVSELNQNQQLGVNTEFQLSSDPSITTGCSVPLLESGPANHTAFLQIFYHVYGDDGYVFCGSLLVEYDLDTFSGQTDGMGNYQIVGVTGNRTWDHNGNPTQVQLVLGLDHDGDNLIYPLACPPLDGNGFGFETTCASCPPAYTAHIRLYVYGSVCGNYVDENKWWQNFGDAGHDITIVPYIPGQPLQYQCPTGIVVLNDDGGGSSGGGGSTLSSLGLVGSVGAERRTFYAHVGVMIEYCNERLTWAEQRHSQSEERKRDWSIRLSARYKQS